jgi:hypothetical protein
MICFACLVRLLRGESFVTAFCVKKLLRTILNGNTTKYLTDALDALVTLPIAHPSIFFAPREAQLVLY